MVGASGSSLSPPERAALLDEFARKLGCDESEEAFGQKFMKIIPPAKRPQQS
jgi:hypothetical protein